MEEAIDLLERALKEVDFFYGEDGPLAKEKKDYIPRESQIEATKEIIKGLIDKSHVIFEGPCGLGKTFTYLTAIGLYAYIMDGNFPKTVVATNGVSLQEQLFYKDVPFIASIFDKYYNIKIEYSLMKGKGNYLCIDKLETIVENTQGFSEPVFKAQYGQKIYSIYKDYIKFKANNSGDKVYNSDTSSLSFVMDYSEQSQVICLKEKECKRKRCSHYSVCMYQRRRAESSMASLVVTNYHMLFIEKRLPMPSLFPCEIIVMDEGHEVPDIYRSTTDKRITQKGIEHAIQETFNIAISYPTVNEIVRSKINNSNILSNVKEFFNQVAMTYYSSGKEDDIIFGMRDLFLANDIFSENLAYSIDSARSVIEGLSDHIEDLAMMLSEEERDDCYKDINSLSDIYNRFEIYSYIIKNTSKIFKDRNLVFWLSIKDMDVAMNIRSVNAGSKIYEQFLSNKNSALCILTSATLATNGNFEYIKKNMGFDLVKENNDRHIVEHIGKSPFDLFSQELWYIPETATSASSDGFVDTMVNQLVDIIEASCGGALCLFTSYKNMNMAYEYVSKNIGINVKIFRQGDLPRLKLLDEFKSDSDSVLFATRSFFTGVDIPGDSLRCVTIDKLPFPQLNDPVMKRLSEINGRDSFYIDSLPAMIITLKQIFGRGVRSTSDKCILAIFDSRIKEASYGTDILKSFSYKKKGAKTIEEVKTFFKQ